MLYTEKAEKLGAYLVALAAQEGHDGEDWDKIQEAGWMLRELAHQRDGLLAAATIIQHRIKNAQDMGFIVNWNACRDELKELDNAIAKAREPK